MSRVPQAATKGGPSLRGAIFCAIFNALLGVVLGFGALAMTPAKEYKATPDAKTGKPPPLPEGVWYWPGGGSGDWRGKEPQFLAEKPGEVVITEGDLNAWAQANMKGAPPIPNVAKSAPKPPPKPAAPPAAASAAGQKAAAPVNTPPSFDFAKGTPNFHIFQDPLSPNPSAFVFQTAMPFNVTVFGAAQTVAFQMRGTITAGANGPQFQPYYCAFGSARLPAWVAGLFMGAVPGALEQTDDGKQYVAAWSKYGTATLRDGELVLTGK